jgi:hypothetical protein
MPDPVTGLIVGGSQLLGGMMQADAAESAAQAQAGAAGEGIAEQRRQFDAIQQLLQPYVQAGTGAIGQFQPFQQAGQQAFQRQQAIAGLLGPAAQREAIAGIEQGPGFQANVRQGEEALLQRASATGGLRGGNIQAALAQFRPQLLQQEIDKQYGRLGGFAGTGLGVSEALYRGGQASAVNQASQAGTLGSNVANLLGQQGAAMAGGELGQARAFGSLLNAPAQFAGIQYGRTGQGFGNLFGGSGSTGSSMGPQYGQQPLDSSFNQYLGGGGTGLSQLDYAVASGGY